MKVLYDISDKFEEELKQLCKKEDLTTADVDAVYKMIDVLKDITTIKAMHNSEANGYSGEYANAYTNDYMRGRSEEYANAYNSYARGRDSMGRYTSRDNMIPGNSRHDKEEMIANLRLKARNAHSEEERANYMDMIERLSM